MSPNLGHFPAVPSPNASQPLARVSETAATGSESPVYSAPGRISIFLLQGTLSFIYENESKHKPHACCSPAALTSA